MSDSMDDHESAGSSKNIGNSFRCKSFRVAKRFPPAMPFLSQSANSGHMPWFLKRSYTDNGRLVLQEVKVKHHQFFRACRINGRLTLRLMHSSDQYFNPRNPDELMDEELVEEEAEEEEEEEEEEENEVIKQEEQEEEEEEQEENEKSDVEKRKRIVGLSLLSPSSHSSTSPLSSPSSPILQLLLKERRRCKLGRWLTQGNTCRTTKNREMFSRAASSPSLLSLARPESPSNIGRVCFPMRRTGYLFEMPMPTIRPVHS